MPIKIEIWYLLFWLIVYPLSAGFYFSYEKTKEQKQEQKKVRIENFLNRRD